MVEALLARVPAARIVATARDTASLAQFAKRDINVRRADYTDPQSLDQAFAGVGRVLLVSSNAVGERVPQHRNVIAAAKRAGVDLLAYTSVLHADTSTLSLAPEHVTTEALLRDSGVPHVLLRNGWYTENYTGSIAAEVAHGAVIGSAGEGRISAATRADYAEAAAAVLAADTPQAGKVYELAGDTAFTMAEYAAEVARQSASRWPTTTCPKPTTRRRWCRSACRPPSRRCWRSARRPRVAAACSTTATR